MFSFIRQFAKLASAHCGAFTLLSGGVFIKHLLEEDLSKHNVHCDKDVNGLDKKSTKDDYLLKLLNDLSNNVTSSTKAIKSNDTDFQYSLSKLIDSNFFNSKLDIVDGILDLLELIPSSILESNVKDALRDIANMSEQFLSEHKIMELSFTHPFLLNLGLIRLFDKNIEAGANNALIQSAKDAKVSEEFVARSKHFLRYAADSYDQSIFVCEDDYILNQLDSSRTGTATPMDLSQALLGEPVTATVNIPRHAVFLDHLTRSVVVCIRGTKSFHDVLTDLHFETIDFPIHSSDVQSPRARGSVRAHRGMAESALALYDSVRGAIETARTMKGGRFRDYEVVVTGHSLGAGTASLLAILLSERALLDVTGYLFASPPVISKVDLRCKPSYASATNSAGSDIFAKVKKSLKSSARSQGVSGYCNIYSFINGSDLIPRCSQHEMLNLISAVMAVDGLPWSASDRIRMLLRGAMSESDVAQVHSALLLRPDLDGKLRNEQDKLLIPGTLFWLKCAEEEEIKGDKMPSNKNSLKTPKYKCYIIDSSSRLSNGLLFSGDTMFIDHLVSKYMVAMSSLRVDA